MVRTDEFALIRFGGDQEKADAVYAGVAEPLVADDIADAVAWWSPGPRHVNIDLLVVRPLAQAAQHKVHRELSREGLTEGEDATRGPAAASARGRRALAGGPNGQEPQSGAGSRGTDLGSAAA